MTQTTDHDPSHPKAPVLAPVLVQGGRKAALTACFVRGATAAGLGLGVFAVLVTVVWISSPYPDSGPGGALRVAAGLWLLAHGAELVRADTLSGQPTPIGVVPLLLVVLPVWLTHRAARDGRLPDVRRPRPSARGTVWAVSLGYLLVGAAATSYAASGPLAADPMTALVRLPLVTVLAAVAGVWTASGRLAGSFPRGLPPSVWLGPARTRATVAVRSSVAATLTLIGGGALLVASSLVWHADATQDTFLHLSGDWSGRLAVLLLAMALVPNAAVWGASYGLGPGFALGTGATATPLAVGGDPSLPQFPLIAAVPLEGPGTLLNWAAMVLPVAAGLVIAWFTAAGATHRPGGRDRANRETALTALLGAVGCGALMALLGAASGGALGTGRLAQFGPVWWLTGAAALFWSAVIAVPVAVCLRIWRVSVRGRGRRTGGTEAPPARGSAAALVRVSGAGVELASGSAASGAAGASGSDASPGSGLRPESGSGSAPVKEPVAAVEAVKGRPFETYDFLPELPLSGASKSGTGPEAEPVPEPEPEPVPEQEQHQEPVPEPGAESEPVSELVSTPQREPVEPMVVAAGSEVAAAEPGTVRPVPVPEDNPVPEDRPVLRPDPAQEPQREPEPESRPEPGRPGPGLESVPGPGPGPEVVAAPGPDTDPEGGAGPPPDRPWAAPASPWPSAPGDFPAKGVQSAESEKIGEAGGTDEAGGPGPRAAAEVGKPPEESPGSRLR
ncbi:DUF6350 family protein [Streptomyces sp. NPDC020965]|uniref:cell division protein PerM n=1 Tax=Streptomyces sp. NPDC020965 TaxID=3365105 RepID=UPI0037887698